MSSAEHDAFGVAGAIFSNNPYEGHPALSPLEAEVLWTYAKLVQHHVKIVHTPSQVESKMKLLDWLIASKKDKSTR